MTEPLTVDELNRIRLQTHGMRPHQRERILRLLLEHSALRNGHSSATDDTEKGTG